MALTYKLETGTLPGTGSSHTHNTGVKLIKGVMVSVKDTENDKWRQHDFMDQILQGGLGRCQRRCLDHLREQPAG